MVSLTVIIPPDSNPYIKRMNGRRFVLPTIAVRPVNNNLNYIL